MTILLPTVFSWSQLEAYLVHPIFSTASQPSPHLLIHSPPYTLYFFIQSDLNKRKIHSPLSFPQNSQLSTSFLHRLLITENPMATTSATMSVITSAVAVAGKKSVRTAAARVNYITGLNSFGGLKAHNNVVSLGLPASADQSFAKIVSALRAPSRNNGGGALSSTCNAISEIFRIASIIPALVLVGVAVGFVLLRIESSVEEAE